MSGEVCRFHQGPTGKKNRGYIAAAGDKPLALPAEKQRFRQGLSLSFPAFTRTDPAFMPAPARKRNRFCGCAKPLCTGTGPFRIRGRQRSNTLDFACKIVCQRGASAPLWKLPAGFDWPPSAVDGPQSDPDQKGAARPLLKPPGQGDAVPPEPPAKEDSPPLDFLSSFLSQY